MQQWVSHSRFNEIIRSATGFLFILLVYTIYKYFSEGHNLEYTIIGISSLICMIGVARFRKIGNLVLFSSTNARFSFFDFLVIDNIIMFLLGILSIYLFLVKGCWGIYKVITSFSFWDLLFRIFILIFSIHLLRLTAILQDLFQTAKRNSR